jgi:hypothetical protein
MAWWSNDIYMTDDNRILWVWDGMYAPIATPDAAGMRIQNISGDPRLGERDEVSFADVQSGKALTYWWGTWYDTLSDAHKDYLASLGVPRLDSAGGQGSDEWLASMSPEARDTFLGLWHQEVEKKTPGVNYQQWLQSGETRISPPGAGTPDWGAPAPGPAPSGPNEQPTAGERSGQVGSMKADQIWKDGYGNWYWLQGDKFAPVMSFAVLEALGINPQDTNYPRTTNASLTTGKTRVTWDQALQLSGPAAGPTPPGEPPTNPPAGGGEGPYWDLTTEQLDAVRDWFRSVPDQERTQYLAWAGIQNAWNPQGDVDFRTWWGDLPLTNRVALYGAWAAMNPGGNQAPPPTPTPGEGELLVPSNWYGWYSGTGASENPAPPATSVSDVVSNANNLLSSWFGAAGENDPTGIVGQIFRNTDPAALPQLISQLNAAYPWVAASIDLSQYVNDFNEGTRRWLGEMAANEAKQQYYQQSTNRQFTADEAQRQAQNAMQMGDLTGTYVGPDGQAIQTLGGRQEDRLQAGQLWQQSIDAANVTGMWTNPTQAGAAPVQTLAAQQADLEARQRYADIMGYYPTGNDWWSGTGYGTGGAGGGTGTVPDPWSDFPGTTGTQPPLTLEAQTQRDLENYRATQLAWEKERFASEQTQNMQIAQMQLTGKSMRPNVRWL